MKNKFSDNTSNIDSSPERNEPNQEPNADSKRQAHASIKGYLYQILHSVNAWLDLAEDETLSLEGIEDFDIISDDTVTAVQVKDTQRNITLRSNDALNAINRYWESQIRNPDRRVKFRFLTRFQDWERTRQPIWNG